MSILGRRRRWNHRSVELICLGATFGDHLVETGSESSADRGRLEGRTVGLASCCDRAHPQPDGLTGAGRNGVEVPPEADLGAVVVAGT